MALANIKGDKLVMQNVFTEKWKLAGDHSNWWGGHCANNAILIVRQIFVEYSHFAPSPQDVIAFCLPEH